MKAKSTKSIRGEGISVNNESLVSVIIPLYNEKLFLAEALESIFNQTYENIEILIIDSSTDSIVDSILNMYVGKIKVLKQSKCGVAGALNYGLENAKGTYIARMDADDIAFSDRIEKQVDYLKKHPDIDVVGSRAIVIDADARTKYISIVPELDKNIETNLIYENPMWHPTLMLRRKLIDAGWRYDVSRKAEDYDMWVRMSAAGIKFANLQEPLLKYRQYGNNLSIVNLEKNEYDAARSARTYLENKLDTSLAEYSDDHFLRVGNKRFVHKRDARFLAKQFELLYTIYFENIKTKAFDSNSLVFELNKRWLEYISPYYVGVTQIINGKNLYIKEEIDRNQIFIETLSRILNIPIEKKSELAKAVESNIIKTRDTVIQWLNEEKKIVLYGCGERGEKVFRILNDLAAKKIVNWRVIGVADKNPDNNNSLFKYIKPQMIVEEEYDYVIVTSNKYYYEIKSQLLGYGVPYRKILENNWLFDLREGL